MATVFQRGACLTRVPTGQTSPRSSAWDLTPTLPQQGRNPFQGDKLCSALPVTPARKPQSPWPRRADPGTDNPPSSDISTGLGLATRVGHLPRTHAAPAWLPGVGVGETLTREEPAPGESGASWAPSWRIQPAPPRTPTLSDPRPRRVQCSSQVVFPSSLFSTLLYFMSSLGGEFSIFNKHSVGHSFSCGSSKINFYCEQCMASFENITNQ